MTRLNDYLRAERPDETEPASFYVPGAPDWKSARKGNRPRTDGGANEEAVDADPIETIDTQELNEAAAAHEAAALKELED